MFIERPRKHLRVLFGLQSELHLQLGVDVLREGALARKTSAP
jgi:hypothetical protein